METVYDVIGIFDDDMDSDSLEEEGEWRIYGLWFEIFFLKNSFST